MIYPQDYSKAKFLLRYMTAQLRAHPSFLVLGAQKAGTTSIYHYLIQHPQIGHSLEKVIRYFPMNPHWEQGPLWYRAHFPLALGMGTKLCFDATPEYLNQPIVPARVFQLYPKMKFIVLLRNPVERAHSHYQHYFRKGWEKNTFEQAIQNCLTPDQDRLEKTAWMDSKNGDSRLVYNSYTYRGKYAEQLTRWFHYFPKEQFIIQQSEHFYANTREAMIEVCNFLGIPYWEDTRFETHNPGGEYPTIDPQFRQQLANYYQPFNEQLYQLIGKDFGWK